MIMQRLIDEMFHQNQRKDVNEMCRFLVERGADVNSVEMYTVFNDPYVLCVKGE